MWTPENRPRYNRDKLRYPSDLTDAEWGQIPAADPASQAWWRQAARQPARGIRVRRSAPPWKAGRRAFHHHPSRQAARIGRKR